MSQTKAIIALIFAILIGGLIFWNNHQGKEIKALEKTNTEQGGVIKGQTQTIELDKGSDQITDDVTAQNAASATAIEAEAKQSAAKIKAKENSIRAKYDKLIEEAAAKPKNGLVIEAATPSEVQVLKEQRAQEISAVRIDSLWEDYCKTETSAECPLPVTTT